jgi:hypothetical protein
MPKNKNKMPNGWIYCPSIANGLIEGIINNVFLLNSLFSFLPSPVCTKGLFLAFKTPLSKRFNHKIPDSARFTLSMLLNDSVEQKVREIRMILIFFKTLSV